MSAVAVSADRRFRRAHVKPGRRRRWRSIARPLIKYGTAALLLSYGLYLGGEAIANARSLQIDRIAVVGNAQLSSDAVVALLDGLKGRNILTTDLEIWRRQLLTSPWVREAALRRVLPASVEVVVQERQPIGLGRVRGGLYLVDDQGVVIDKYGAAYAEFDLPIIDGLFQSPKAQELVADADRAALAGRLIGSLRPAPEIGSRLSQVDVSDVRNASVILSGDATVLYVGTDRFLPRLQAYLQLAETMKERVPEIDSLDLRFDNRIYARLAGRPARGEARARAARAPAAEAGETSRR